MSGLLLNKSRDAPINLFSSVKPKDFKINDPALSPQSIEAPMILKPPSSPIGMPPIPEPTSLNQIDDESFQPSFTPPSPPSRPSTEDDDDDSVSSYCGSDLTPEEVTKKKKILLYRLKRFQKKGFGLSRVYNMESDLVDLRAEVESIKREANLGATVTTMKKGIQISTYLIELLNHQFDPINAKLDGWSNQVKGDLENGDFDEVLEELYDKYTDRLHMPPEMRLLSMLGTSALQYHIAQVVVKQTLDQSRTEQILQNNPKIKKDIMTAFRNSKKSEQIPESNYTETQTSEQKEMEDPADIDGILQELKIEDENNKVLSTNF